MALSECDGDLSEEGAVLVIPQLSITTELPRVVFEAEFGGLTDAVMSSDSMRRLESRAGHAACRRESATLALRCAQCLSDTTDRADDATRTRFQT